MSETQDQNLGPKERKAKYKKSLNLPRTSFPMRANLAQNEGQSRKRWDREGLFESLMENRADAEPFVFHDGPPYANGDMHLGHLLNKVLKDIVVRSRNLAGQRCHYVPGWDCHGLPIEHKVMTGLVQSGKLAKLDGLEPDTRRMAIRRECHKYATKYKKLQASQMQRLMTLADYDHPYLTMVPEYERDVLGVFAGLVEQGLVYRDLKPVHWSIANQTALADAELEYRDREDPSIYVCFDAVDATAL
ncbi:MAG: class I tRNA ligase family protein, partial [Acidobacteriota bacterium]